MHSATMIALLVLSGPFAGAQDAGQPAAGGVSVVGNVGVIDEVIVAAREAGALTELTVREGAAVAKDDELGTIDDSDAQARLLAAQAELQIAHAQAESDAAIQAAEATRGVAQQELAMAEDINVSLPNAVSQFELNRLGLTVERAFYQMKEAELEKRIAELTRDARNAQVVGVRNEIARRKIVSPIDGIVQRRLHHPGEWVQPGDPVYRIIRMDRLRFEGLMRADDFERHEIEGRQVVVYVEQSHGEEIEIPCTITYASPEIDTSGRFVIYADFDNPQLSNGYWQVRPGSNARLVLR